MHHEWWTFGKTCDHTGKFFSIFGAENSIYILRAQSPMNFFKIPYSGLFMVGNDGFSDGQCKLTGTAGKVGHDLLIDGWLRMGNK